jgi:hypothetical protein
MFVGKTRSLPKSGANDEQYLSLLFQVNVPSNIILILSYFLRWVEISTDIVLSTVGSILISMAGSFKSGFFVLTNTRTTRSVE